MHDRPRPRLIVATRPWSDGVARDCAAGLLLTGLLVPAGMGYAAASGLPPSAGLAATVVALVAYAIVGPSRVLVLGPDSSLAPLIAAAVLPAAAGNSDRAVALAGLLALLVGVILLVASIARLGLVMDLLSTPIRMGYLHGVALVVIVSQLPALLGMPRAEGDLLAQLGHVLDGISAGDVDGAAAAVGIASLVAVLALRVVSPRWPGMLAVVVASGFAVWALDLDDVAVVGPLDGGLPTPALGGLRASDLLDLLPAAVGIALVSFADTGVLSRAFAARSGSPVEPDREMAALGVSNVACGALGGFPISASASRTPVAHAVGARSQLTGIVAAAAVVALVLGGGDLTRYLPVPTLAAVVIAAVITIVDVPALVRLARMSPTEFVLCTVAFLGVAAIGVLEGIVVAVGLSMLVFAARAWRPYMAELVRIDRRKGYHDRSRHPDGARVPGLLLVRFDAPLFFANAETFARFVRTTIADAPTPTRWIVVAAEPITDIDTTAAEVLTSLDDELAAAGVRLVFAELKGPVRDRLRRYELDDRFGPDRFFPTLGTAVSAYVRETGTPWRDWTDNKI